MKVVFDSDYMNFNYVEIKDTITGIDDNQIAMIQLYPNLFKNTLNLSFEGEFNYQISDVTGNVIVEGKAEQSISFENQLKSGVYLVNIFNDVVNHTFKVTKE